MSNKVYTISSDESDSEANNNGGCVIMEPVTMKAFTKDSETYDDNAMDVVSSTVTIDEDDRSSNVEQIQKDNPVEHITHKRLGQKKRIGSDFDLDSSDSSSDESSQDIHEKQKRNGSPISKGRKKGKAALLKKTKKQKLAEEKAAKKTANEMNKIYKPGECMKYMNVEGHPSLWSRWYMSDVSREVTAVGARVVQANTLCDPALVVWTRTLPRSLRADDGQVKLSPSEERCDRALYIADADELSELVSSHSLASHLAHIQLLCDCKMTLLVFRVKDYFKSTGRKTTNSNKTPMKEIDFELAITDLLVSAGCDTVIANTPNELALTIVQFTKAIAEAPYKKAKRACDEQAEFYMRGDNKKCVAVDKDGVGVSRLWQQMIAILPQSSLETSRALCAKYKSPLLLFNKLQYPASIEAIADIGVCRAATAEAKARRIGPEFARKLHTLFTSNRGDALVE